MKTYDRLRLWLIRGLAGSGKSTLAHMLELIPNEAGYHPAVYEADDYFMQPGPDGGGYVFDKDKLASAHLQCLNNAHEAMSFGLRDVIVSNTFSQNWEMEPYRKFAKQFDYSVFVIECQNNFGSIHNVPEEVVERMRQRWERF
jgi:predicted kinase